MKIAAKRAERKSISFTIRITDTTLKKVKIVCKAIDVSQSALFESAIDEIYKDVKRLKGAK